MPIEFSFRFDPGSIPDKLDRAGKDGQHALDQQVLKDSNSFAPEDEGTLIESAIRSSEPGSGKIIWDTPYARRLYYNPGYNFSKDKNPRAQGLWFEAAKAQHGSEWEQVVADAYRKLFRG